VARIDDVVDWGTPVKKHADDVRASIGRSKVERRCGEAIDGEISWVRAGRAGDEKL